MNAQQAIDGGQSPQGAAEGAVGAEALRARAEATGVGTIMSRSVVCLSPAAEVHAVTEMFLDRDFSSAPVVDGEWLPLGVVSKTDLLRHFSGGVAPPASLRQVGRLRPPPEASPPPRSPASIVAAAALASGVGDASGPGEVQVADIAAPYVLSLHEEAPISVAAALMAYEGVHRLPIVDTGGQVVGVVSTLDIVRWLAESTGAGPQGG